jgi:hypothetical membrane protein
MTSIDIERAGYSNASVPATGRSVAQTILLVCGVVASVLYLATDILGGLKYDGYSFTSQMVSELMAIGAPSERFVDPLFITYGILTVAFGVGVLREAAKSERAIRATGVLLIIYALAGLPGPILFEMHQRGTTGNVNDLPHILLTIVLVLCLLLSMAFGAFAFGKRFRQYSFATIIVAIVCGALGFPYGARLAAGLTTTGFGIIERVNIYASLAWISVFAIMLLRNNRLDNVVRSAS